MENMRRYTPVRTTTTTTTRARTLKAPLSLRVLVPLSAPAADIMSDVGRFGAAKRRRDRQLRAFHPHEQLTVRMELATALHHSSQRPKSRVVEGPSEEEVHEHCGAPRRQKRPPPGTRPGVPQDSHGRERGCPDAVAGRAAAGWRGR